jgi:hypothetical protein
MKVNFGAGTAIELFLPAWDIQGCGTAITARIACIHVMWIWLKQATGFQRANR